MAFDLDVTKARHFKIVNEESINQTTEISVRLKLFVRIGV